MNRRMFLTRSLAAGIGLALSPALLKSIPRPSESALGTPSGIPTPTASGEALPPASYALSGAVQQVHDPCIIKEGDTYHLFSTGPHIWWRTSPDLKDWELRGGVFGVRPAWTHDEIPLVDSLWAPDISHYNGRYHLYYSVSTFGSNRSCIGLATNATLDSQSPEHQWVDEGKVIESNPTDNWNAIDPNLVLDENGLPWLTFGSFWSGIKMRQIDPATGKPSSANDKLYSLARRDLIPGTSGAIEAPFIIRREDFYYLFVSFDFCCKGTLSTYNIRVGRAKQVTGPYFDREGTAMLSGGGTLVLEGDDRWRGPGHNAVLHEADGDKLVYHAYDAKAAGIPTLRISPMVWDADGWPTASP